MARDLWSSSYDQVVQDGNYSEHPGWQCDFYFGCGHDVIEEDALNEKSCIQVLRILITKEDNELEELGKDFLSLQSELACAEHEKWPELCFSALSEKINWLDVSIRTLKNDHADNIETQPLSHNKPAETLHEIVKTLRRDYCQDAYSQELLAKAHVRGPNLRAISCASSHSEGIKLSDASNLKVTGNEEDRRSQLVTKDTGQIPNSFFSKGKGNAPKEAKIVQEGNAIVKDDSTYAFGLAAGIKGREKCLGSRLSDSQQAESGNDGNSDSDQKLRDFASKTERRVSKKVLVALAEDLDSKNSPLRAVYTQELCLAGNELSSFKGNSGKNSQVMNIKNASLNHAKLQSKSIQYSGSELTDEEEPQAHDLKSEISANLSKSNMSLPSKLKNQVKKKPELDAFSEREPINSPMELASKASTISTSKGQQKSRTSISIDGASLNKSLVRKITGREVQPSQRETAVRAIVPYDSKFSELQKKRKVDVQTSALLPIKLKDLTLSDLRAIAKEHNVRRYYKLSKGALVEQLVDRLSSC